MLYSKLNTLEWFPNDYTSTTTNGLSGVIYTDPSLSSVKSLTGYTLKIRLYDQDGYEVFSDDAVVLVAASGTWEYLPSLGELHFDFIGELVVELAKSGEVLTATGVNGSSKLRIRYA